MYLPPADNLNFNELHQLTQLLPQPDIFTRHFNARNIVWGSLRTDQRGKIIIPFLNLDDLMLLNISIPTGFNIYNGATSAIEWQFSSTS